VALDFPVVASFSPTLTLPPGTPWALLSPLLLLSPTVCAATIGVIAVANAMYIVAAYGPRPRCVQRRRTLLTQPDLHRKVRPKQNIKDGHCLLLQHPHSVFERWTVPLLCENLEAFCYNGARSKIVSTKVSIQAHTISECEQLPRQRIFEPSSADEVTREYLPVKVVGLVVLHELKRWML
jgi:hypothetical protein